MSQYFIPFLSSFWASQMVVPMCSSPSLLGNFCREVTWEKCLTEAASGHSRCPSLLSVVVLPPSVLQTVNCFVLNDLQFLSVLLPSLHRGYTVCGFGNLVSFPAPGAAPVPRACRKTPLSACNVSLLSCLKEGLACSLISL